MTAPVGATDYVLSRSVVCRRFKRHTRALTLNAVDFLSTLPAEAVEQSKPQLTAHLRIRVEERQLGNPILIFILMYVVIPIIVQLIIQWWINR